MAEILKYAHDTESPIFSYNHETELSAVVNLVYLSARDRYRVEREGKALWISFFILQSGMRMGSFWN